MALDGSLPRGGAGSDREKWIRESYSRILTSCVCAGLAPADADDVAQDIWVWLLRQGPPIVVFSMPWVAAVTRNFVLRYRRKNYRQSVREGRALESIPEPRGTEVLPGLEVNELLERVAAVLPDTERKLLTLIRSGHTLAEAARILGIPRGSRAYYHGRLIACARRELGGTTAVPYKR